MRALLRAQCGLIWTKNTEAARALCGASCGPHASFSGDQIGPGRVCGTLSCGLEAGGLGNWVGGEASGCGRFRRLGAVGFWEVPKSKIKSAAVVRLAPRARAGRFENARRCEGVSAGPLAGSSRAFAGHLRDGLAKRPGGCGLSRGAFAGACGLFSPNGAGTKSGHIGLNAGGVLIMPSTGLAPCGPCPRVASSARQFVCVRRRGTTT